MKLDRKEKADRRYPGMTTALGVWVSVVLGIAIGTSIGIALGVILNTQKRRNRRNKFIISIF